MTDPTDAPETVTTAPEQPDDTATTAPQDNAPATPTEPQQDDDATTFPAEYVRRLRAEAAEARVRAKIADAANEHLLAAYAKADGRLVDVEALPLTADLYGDDGLVAPDRVTTAIDALIGAKPYLLARRPTTPIVMGVQADATPDPTWLDVLRGTR